MSDDLVLPFVPKKPYRGQKKTDWGKNEEDEKQAKSQREKILLYLLANKDRWVSTSEIVAVGGHEIHSRMSELREDGHLIERIPTDGKEHLYQWQGQELVFPITKEHKDAYYTTGHWKQCRARRMAFDAWRCIWCKKAKELQVHHMVYDLFNEDNVDLMTLCKECHKRMHVLAKIRFPKYADNQEILNRLTLAKDDQCRSTTDGQSRSTDSTAT
jgi:hypothetical protein